MREVVILGSTGSIGRQALDVIGARRAQFKVVGLSAAGSQPGLLADQVLAFAPELVGLANPDAVDAFKAELAVRAASRGLPVPQVDLQVGPEANVTLARTACDVVLNAITGAAGLLSTLACLAEGTRLALANKESLVIGGALVTRAARPGQLVAVDSEHSAFAQCLRAGQRSEVRRLVLTASGGPFRGWTREQMAAVTPEQAMAHPTWHMGRVITINSSTLVNKGLELLEAALLYDVPLDAIQVVVHPQSIVHSGVEFVDGATIVQASPPDMRLPISLALAWPDRVPRAAQPLDWRQASNWTFEPLDAEAFPAVELARRAGIAGGTAPAVYNAANEVGVDAFCARRIGFLDIVDTVACVLDEHLGGAQRDQRPGARHVGNAELSLDAVLAADSWARIRAAELLDS